MRFNVKYVFLTLLLLILAAFPLALQYQTGSLEGTVASQRGPIAGASVEVRNIMTGAFLTVKTDAAGHYKFARLRAGRYSLWVEIPEYTSVWVPRILIERGQTTYQDVFAGQWISSNL